MVILVFKKQSKRKANETDEKDYKKLNYYRTSVPIYKTQNEIRTVLEKFNLQGTRFTEYKNTGIIEFILLKDNKEIAFRFKYNLPEKESLKQQVYRALFYYLKNRFLAVEFGITTVEEEFLQEIVVKLPNGTATTVKELVGEKVLKLQYNDLKILKGE